MDSAYLLGIYSTAAGRFPDRSFKDLIREACVGALADVGMKFCPEIGTAWFGNCLMDYWGQSACRGHVCLAPLIEDGVLPDRTPVVNVEGGCATGSLAFHGAWKEILAGQAEVALAIGVEKLYDANNPKTALDHILRAGDQLDPDHWMKIWQEWAAGVDKKLEFGSDHSFAMDFYAIAALEHMKRYGTTQRQIALAAALCHNYGAKNPRAQYRFETTVDQVLSDRMVSYPLTRSMCAPIGDAAAAALVCSASYLKRLPAAARKRALKIRACALAGGKYAPTPNEPKTAEVAAKMAYRMSGLSPRDIDVVELHDATSFAMVHLLEDLGFCAHGEGGPFIESGATQLGRDIPVNVSGGLVSRGHPLGATGLMMLNELALQLRGEAGEMQVDGARVALQENGGGIVGREIASASVIILERES
ncbi:MAG: thiolase family protein [Candidatus Binataceae bacterium]|jgi:acetyl-CoA acetyltransferase